MPKGGARSRSGPQPEMTALARERDIKTFTRLPRECTKPVPEWPVEIADPTVAELAMWERYWHLPQAHVWHADHVGDSVALYVRMFLAASGKRASAQLLTEIRQTRATLLLDIGALNAARYIIVDSPEDEILGQVMARTGTDGGGPARPGPGRSARSRMAVVTPIVTPSEPDADDEEPDDPDA